MAVSSPMHVLGVEVDERQSVQRSLSTHVALLGLTFIYIFGWKITPALDLVLLSSAGLACWVFVLSRINLARVEVLITATLLVLSIYSCLVAVYYGAVDIQVALRSIRSLVNFLGGVALVRLYQTVYGQEALKRVGLSIYSCILLHAILICAMFLLPGLRALVYSIANTLDYVNLTAPFLLGLRIPGLTYGFASTSVVQLCGVLLLPFMLHSFGRGTVPRTLIWISVVPLIISLFLTGRTGLVLAGLFAPVLLLLCREKEGKQKVGFSRVALPLVIVASGIAVVGLKYSDVLQKTFWFTLRHSSEILELLESGQSRTTQTLQEMYFLPDDANTLLFGSSNLGRGELRYISSDVGYIKLVFAVGLIGVTLSVIPYLIGLVLASRWYRATSTTHLAVATGLCLLSGLLLNAKELALLTRNQWSIQSLLIAASIVYLTTRLRTAKGAGVTNVP